VRFGFLWTVFNFFFSVLCSTVPSNPPPFSFSAAVMPSPHNQEHTWFYSFPSPRLARSAFYVVTMFSKGTHWRQLVGRARQSGFVSLFLLEFLWFRLSLRPSYVYNFVVRRCRCGLPVFFPWHYRHPPLLLGFLSDSHPRPSVETCDRGNALIAKAGFPVPLPFPPKIFSHPWRSTLEVMSIQSVPPLCLFSSPLLLLHICVFLTPMMFFSSLAKGVCRLTACDQRHLRNPP